LEGTGIVEGNVREHDTHYSAAVDAYGFGMVCYELLTGFIPFEAIARQTTSWFCLEEDQSLTIT